MLNVLVVDDDKLVRKGLISAMPWAKFGLQVAGEAKNGEKALELLQSMEIDLLLTDLAMPVMSGLDLMRIVRQRYPHIFIVVLTLHQDFEYIQEALRLGAIDYIAKVQLEEENFDEVLGRITRRIAAEQVRLAAQAGERAQPGMAGEAAFYGIAAAQPARNRMRDSDATQRGIDTQQLAAVRATALSLDWVHEEALFHRWRDDLRQLLLPAAQLVHELGQWAEDWNRLYEPIAARRIEAPAAPESWPHIEQWLTSCRQQLLEAIGKPQYSAEVRECIAKAVQLIRDNIAERLNLVDICREVNMSRGYFSQCFKDITGTAFNDYVRRQRVEKAKEYLEKTSKTILWIAEHTGYADEKYFSRIFRKHTGYLPSEYRQLHRIGREMSDK